MLASNRCRDVHRAGFSVYYMVLRVGLLGVEQDQDLVNSGRVNSPQIDLNPLIGILFVSPQLDRLPGHQSTDGRMAEEKRRTSRWLQGICLWGHGEVGEGHNGFNLGRTYNKACVHCTEGEPSETSQADPAIIRWRADILVNLLGLL